MTLHEDVPYLKHMIDAMNDIEESIENKTKEDFVKNKDVKDATIRRIEVLGEAAKNISTELKTKHPEVPWKGIIGMRDKLIHHYLGVDLDQVWVAVKEDIPKLKRQIQSILDEV